MKDATKDGLNTMDLQILEKYALAGNRELYFNYLAQKQGSDGYGLLALGVVRNDNAPGATANSFADRQARQDGATLNEGQWQAFGVELIQRDVALRRRQLEDQRPDLALNLPVREVQKAHDDAFNARDIDPSAWTPYKLLDAARKHGGDPEAEAVWTMLLDNSNLGVDRAQDTTALVMGKYRELIDNPAGYLQDMALARGPHGVRPISNLDPDRISHQGRMYLHDDATGSWRREVAVPLNAPVVPVPIGSLPVGSREVTDPQLRQLLDDAREVRQLREELRGQFQPDDVNKGRPIMASPFVLSDATSPEVQPERQLAAADPTAPGHARHALYQQCAAGVRGVDAGLGKPWDTQSECLAASLTTLAAGSDLRRVDHVLMGRPTATAAEGPNVFVVQGDLADPAHLRAQMPVAQALATPVEQSFQQLAVKDQRQAQEQSLQRDQEQQLQQTRSAPAMV